MGSQPKRLTTLFGFSAAFVVTVGSDGLTAPHVIFLDPVAVHIEGKREGAVPQPLRHLDEVNARREL